MNLTTAGIILLLLQNGYSIDRLKAAFDALGVPPSEYAGVDLMALHKAIGGDDEPEEPE